MSENKHIGKDIGFYVTTYSSDIDDKLNNDEEWKYFDLKCFGAEMYD